MAPLSLKIILEQGAVTRKVKFDLKTSVRDAHAIVKGKVIVPDPSKEYALFLRSADDDSSGIWLEPQHSLDYYMLKDGDCLDYICKVRNLRVKLLDGSVKTLQVDEWKPVSELMIGICGRLGITNHDEYGLCPEEEERTEDLKDQPQTGTLTMKRKHQPKDKGDVALQQLSRKLNTDDNVEWLDQHRTLREQGIDSTCTVILKRRLFYSDRNVDARDPVQLNLLYVQTRDAILNGRHLVTEEQAQECKIRWINIRTVHRSLLKNNLNNGTKKTYKYENELSFMMPFYRDVAPPLILCDEVSDSYKDQEHDWKISVTCDVSKIKESDISSSDFDEPIEKSKLKRKRKLNTLLKRRKNKN